MTRLFVEALTVIDCGVLDAGNGLVGASWIVDADLSGSLDSCGMIVDFGPAKRLLKQQLDARVDHRLLLAADAPGLAFADADEGVDLTFTDDRGARLRYRAPATAVCRLPGTAVSADGLARLLEAEAANSLPANVSALTLRLRPETIDGAHYNYCHGLKRHRGNCQRLGHGHRSRLQIFVDGKRCQTSEQAWCQRWRNIFLGNRDDLVGSDRDPRYRFAYQAGEGRFELELNADRCALLDAETTVENIAAHIAAALKREQPGARIAVRAYEGVGKGAEAVLP